MNNTNGGNEEREGRISLRSLDRLMQGDLPEAEAAALREAASRSPEAREYLAKYSGMGSNLTLARIRARRRGSFGGAAGRMWEGLRATLLGGRAGRAGLALTCLLVVGLGSLTWKFRSGAESAAERDDSRFRAKGAETGFRLVIGGIEYEPGQLAAARSGDTLEVTYRSSGPVRARIWYREEGGEPAAMDGKSETLSWEAATAWKRAPERIVLDGEWIRQTVWVVWSSREFSEREARKAVEGNSPRPDLHAEAFRLSRPQ